MVGKIVDVDYLSLEWYELAKTTNGASEAAIMMGLSPYMKRDELVRLKATGEEQAFSSYVKNVIFPRGHEVEAKIKPYIEELLEEEIFPVVMVDDDGNRASCDGLTISREVVVECKQYNKELFESVSHYILPDYHEPQCQQQLMITGATELLFVVTDGTPENTATMWVYPEPEYQDRIRLGWRQFNEDVKNYKATEEKVVTAEIVESLPVVFVKVEGSVIESNLPNFKLQADLFLSKINKNLVTDNDFATAKNVIKACDTAEKNMLKAEELILSQLTGIYQEIEALRDYKGRVRDERLALEKLVKKREQEIKTEIAQKASEDLSEYVSILNKKLSVIIPVKILIVDCVASSFIDAMKNKKTFTSIQDAVNTALANAKVEAEMRFNVLRDRASYFKQHHLDNLSLFPDLQSVLGQDGYIEIIAGRIADHEQRQKEIEQKNATLRSEETKQLEVSDRPIEEQKVVEKVSKYPIELTTWAAEVKEGKRDIFTAMVDAFNLGKESK